MKILVKVRIQRIQDATGTHYIYPAAYIPEKIQVICYETMLTGKIADVVGRGNDHEFMVGVIDEADKDQFLKSSNITVLTRQEAENFIGTDLTASINKITDENKVLLICAKAALGETLTDDDKKALNPDDPTAGIGRSRNYSETLDAHGV